MLYQIAYIMLFFVVSTSVYGQNKKTTIYKWRDEHGVIHFGSKPNKNTQSEELKFSISKERKPDNKKTPQAAPLKPLAQDTEEIKKKKPVVCGRSATDMRLAKYPWKLLGCTDKKTYVFVPQKSPIPVTYLKRSVLINHNTAESKLVLTIKGRSRKIKELPLDAQLGQTPNKKNSITRSRIKNIEKKEHSQKTAVELAIETLINFSEDEMKKMRSRVDRYPR